MRLLTAIGFFLVTWLLPGLARSQADVDVEYHRDEAAVAQRAVALGLTFNLTADHRLRQLFAADTEISGDFLASLRSCKSLQSISLGQHPSHFEALAQLPELPTLEMLGVTCPLRSAARMDWVRRLPNLQGLNLEAPQSDAKLPEPALWDPGDSDAAVAELRFLKNLRLLRLNRQQVTAAGLAPLAVLKKLRQLELNSTPVDDAALEQVAKLENLETLYLAGTAITDRGIAQLGRLGHLTGLKLDGTAITDRALDTLREFDGLRGIRYLYLADTKVSDEGMKALADLTSLQVLDLSNTQVTDAGLVQLAKLKKLYNVNLSGVCAEEETVRWLGDQLPKRGAIVCYQPPAVPLALRQFRQRRRLNGPASETPILQACKDWSNKGDAKSALRVLELAVQLRNEVNKHLPYRPYSAPVAWDGLGALPHANPGRHTLLSSVQYASNRPPGPGESYIHTCLVFIDGDLLGTRLERQTDSKGDPILFNGYISNSVVVVDGAVGISSYIADSIVLASGPIAVHDGYISNSLVISLDSLLPLATKQTASLDTPTAQPLLCRPSIYMRDGSIRNSVVVGTVACSDLRDCIILGSVTSREPHLSGAEILEPGGVARLPWEIGKD